MRSYNPPHEVRDQQKLQEMIALLERGESLPPVLVCGYDAYTGSHRLAAWEALDMPAEIIEITEDQWVAIMEAAGFAGGSITDYEDFRDWANDLYDLGAQ